MLVAGNVIIGRREEGEKDSEEHVRAESGQGSYERLADVDRDQEEGVLVAEELELDEDSKEADDDDIPQLGLEDKGRQGKSMRREGLLI